MVSVGVVVCFAVLAVIAATNVNQCPGMNIPSLRDKVKLEPCKKIPCKLKKKTTEYIFINFTPETDMDNVKTHVTGELFGVPSPIPFMPVDGQSICDKVFAADGTRASCPLKAGTPYTYKDSFLVRDDYPSTNIKVHWGLVYGDKEFTCFEVPVRIR